MWTEPNGKVWRIRESVAGEKITLATGYATKTAADNALILMKADVLRGDALVPRGGELTLTEWVDTWWPTYKRALKETSRTSIQGIIDRYIKSMLGHLTLAEISDQPITVQRWVNDLLDGKTTVKHPRPLASKTVRNAHGQLYVIFAAAITNKLIRHNPCEHTLLPEEDDGEMRFLDYEEAAILIKNVPDEWRPLIMLFLATGLRWSEAMGLRVRDIEVAAGRLYVRLNRVEVGGRFHDQTPKTKRGKRYVSFPTFIGDILGPLLKGKGKEDRVFTAKRGGDIRHKEFYVVWHEVRVLAGLPGLRLHDLRHTHISWLIAANVPLSAISRRAGHKSVAFTDERYGHLLKIVDEGVIEAVESAMSKIEYRGDVGELNPAQPPASHD